MIRKTMSLQGLASKLAIAGVAALTIGTQAMAQTVKISTNQGDIIVQLETAKAPKSVDNFLQYAKAGHYNGTIFHRVIDGFMIQGGGFTPDMQQKPTRSPIPLESRNGLSNVRGTLAMARTNVPDSATSQFFINVKDNGFLDSARSPDGNGYAVFGKVTQGMDVVDKIRKVETSQRGPFGDVPVQPVIIKQVTIEK
ncbi:MAG: peptidyl-prolyl cis-trans isomerase [Aquabacterium sp.]|jgi:peptidyl-prolyl cis-trans isomerase A (cyclophilin A)|nr:peptidyl-prolyl cis-trans isomerase [Aquabacterium sp.]